MSKLYDDLQRQLKMSEYKQDAEDCIKIYNQLKIIYNHVWESSWNALTTVKYIGVYPNAKRICKPNQIGYIFLKSIEKDKKSERGIE